MSICLLFLITHTLRFFSATLPPHWQWDNGKHSLWTFFCFNAICTLLLVTFALCHLTFAWHKALNIRHKFCTVSLGTFALHNFNYFNMSLDTQLHFITTHLCFNWHIWTSSLDVIWILSLETFAFYIWRLCTLNLTLFTLHLMFFCVYPLPYLPGVWCVG